MNYFYNRFSKSLFHSANKEHAKYGTANSVSSEKGTDNKKNNTSEYNHEYYEGNKDKWKDNKSSSSKKSTKSNDDDRFYDKDGKARFGHKDYDENDPDFKRTDGEKIAGTELRTFTNSNGSTIIMGKGIKFSFPPGTKITSAMAKKLAEIEGGDKSNKEAYVAKMLNAVTGFADKQGLNTDVKKKSSKKSGDSEAKKEESKKSDSKDPRDWDKVRSDSAEKRAENKSKSSTKKPLTYDVEKWKKKTSAASKEHSYYKKKKSSVSHSDDLGSVFVKDIL